MPQLWSNLSDDEKTARVLRLRDARNMALTRAKGRAKGRAKAPPKRTGTRARTFTSDAHKAFFDSMPPDLQKRLFGR